MNISTEHFGRLHYNNGPANAFRHAFWNFLIAKRCYNWRKKEEAVLKWTEKITDWHENAFPNRDLAKAMDLHNNRIGRRVFKERLVAHENKAVELLKQMALDSVKIDSKTQLNSLKNKMVHITDEK